MFKIFITPDQEKIGRLNGEPINWRPTIYGVLKNEKGEVYIVKNVHGGLWGLPGGGVEVDETIEKALEREFFEETGFRVKTSHIKFLKETAANWEDEFYHCLIFVGEVELTGEARDESIINYALDGYEIEDHKWINLKDFKEEDFYPFIWEFIKSL